MASPFIYEEPVPPERVLDREAELATLVDRVLDGRNSRLEAPRRYGKTSLLRKVMAECAGERVGVYVNFLGVLTAADVAERIERAYGEQLDSRLRQWFTGLARTLHPTVKAGGAPVGVQVSPAPPETALLERLSVPRRLLEKHGRRCLIVFDEFQDLLRAGERLDDVFRSEIEQQGDAAAYIFSGSHPGLMRELFATRRRAFFGQAAPVDLGPLRAEDLAEAIGAGFADGRRDPGAALGSLLDLAAGHPQRAMLLAHHLFEATSAGDTADSDTWAAALRAACHEVDGEVTELWRGLTATQQRVIALIADEQTAVNGARAREVYGLPRTGANRQAIDALEARGEIVAAATRSKWRVVDPLMRLWLANGRVWPFDG